MLKNVIRRGLRRISNLRGDGCRAIEAELENVVGVNAINKGASIT